jgi:hypothetical protein
MWHPSRCKGFPRKGLEMDFRRSRNGLARHWRFALLVVGPFVAVSASSRLAQAQAYAAYNRTSVNSRITSYPLNTAFYPRPSMGGRSTYIDLMPARPVGRTPIGLFGRPYRPGGPSVVTRMYSNAQRTGPLGLKPQEGGRFSTSRMYRTIAPPEQPTLAQEQRAERGSEFIPRPTSRPAEVRIDETPDVLAKDRLEARREAYLYAGWQFFKEEKFREACENFLLADRIVFMDPAHRAECLKKRAEVKLAVMYGSIACGRFAQAVNALTWLLTQDKVTDELPDPLFLARTEDIREKYGRPAVFDEHLANLEMQVAAEKQTPQIVALKAVALWADAANVQSRIDAEFAARKLAEPRKFPEPMVPLPWRDLNTALLRAKAVHEAERAEANASDAARQPTDIRLPWEKSAGESPVSRPASVGR